MSLRLRLVLALVTLLTIGLVVFGVATSGWYARSEYRRLDDSLRSSRQNIAHRLTEAAGLVSDGDPSGQRGAGGGSGPTGSSPSGPASDAVIGSWAQLRDANGTILKTFEAPSGNAPAVPEGSLDYDKPVTVGGSVGGGSWRLLATHDDRFTDYVVLLAVPTSNVAVGVRRLVAIELVAGAALLALLAGGSGLILRRGLRPLETMAATARSISAGDLSQRVTPADGRTEVGELGQAINTMLGDLEVAFDERQQTEHRLRQFLADASHELRTPLTSIQGFAELYRLGHRSEHVDREVIMRRIEEESARMRVLVEDLLLLARLDQHRPVETGKVDLAVLAADSCSDAVAADPGRAVTLDAPDPVIVAGVEAHLRQAVANMVTNALRHTAAGTPIEVSAGTSGAKGVVRVRDHGGGLDGEALAHVFDRFWQADKARAGHGAGLGLAIVAGIADEHGGGVAAANAEGGGAVFTLTLPLDA